MPKRKSQKEKERELRKTVIRLLKRKGAIYRQAEIHRIVGTGKLKAGEFKALLEKMADEKLIDKHWRNHDGERIGGEYWSTYDHPDNVEMRKKRREWKEESERTAKIRKERLRQQEIENAPRLAKEKFIKDFNKFLHGNYNEVFELFTLMYRHHKQKTAWLHSRYYD